MLAAHCTNCGATAPASLATPDRIDCDHCGFSGPTPPEVAARLRAAAQVLWQVGERGRQLSALHRVQATRANWGTFLYLLLLVLLVLPFSCGAGACVFIGSSPEPWQVLVILAPLVVMLFSGSAGLWWIRRAARKVQEANSAIAPVVAGRPARCHVCGAPLTVGSNAVLARCGFCRADNVVTHDVVERVRHRNVAVLDGFEQEVRRSSNTANVTTVLASIAMMILSYGLPLLTVLVAFVVFVVLYNTQSGPDPSIEYVGWPAPQGECLARVERHGDGAATLTFSDDPPVGLKPSMKVKELAGRPTYRANDLVGKHLVRSDGLGGRVVRVFTTPAYHDANRAKILVQNGTSTDDDLVGRCFAKGAYPRELGKLPERTGKTPAFFGLEPGAVVVGVSNQLVRFRGDESEVVWREQSGYSLHGFAADDESYYLCDRKDLLGVPRAGEGAAPARVIASLKCTGRSLGIDAQYVYVATSTSLVRVPKAGGEPETLTGVGAKPTEVVLSGNQLYVLDAATGAIWQRATGGAEARLVSGSHAARPTSALVALKDTLYWLTPGDELIALAPNAAPRVVTTCKDALGPFAVYDESVVWASIDDRSATFVRGALWSRAFAGGPPRALTGRINEVLGLAVDGERVLWVESYADSAMVTLR